MTVHLLKWAVGIDSAEDLARRQAARRLVWREGAAGQRSVVPGFTRRMPRRRAEILEGGSLYWIIRGRIVVRQPILDLEEAVDEAGQGYCRIIFEPDLVATQARRHRPMQGWRYLAAEDAPADVGGEAGVPEDLPPELAARLVDLGIF